MNFKENKIVLLGTAGVLLFFGGFQRSRGLLKCHEGLFAARCGAERDLPRLDLGK